MRIGLIDNDLSTRANNHFPNLALMKLSSYHKNKGDDVELVNIALFQDSLFPPEYDIVYCAKVFTDTYTPEYIKNKDIIFGGSGFYFDKSPKLIYEIEHSKPDYNLYSSSIINKHIGKNYIKYYTDYSIGFTTRGCFRKCSFCINKNETQVYKHSDIAEFIDTSRPYIMLLDDNILAFKDYKKVFYNLNKTGKKFVFKQGMDFRLLTDSKIKMLLDSNYKDTFHFAFDDINDRELIVKIFEKWIKIHKIGSGSMLFYIFSGFDRNGIYNDEFFINDIKELIERVEIVTMYGAYPYIMFHKDISKSPYNYYLQRLRKVLNVPLFLNNKSFESALIQDKKQDVVEWLKKLGYNNFLKKGYNI